MRYLILILLFLGYFTSSAQNIPMVPVHGGTFIMGATDEQKKPAKEESPTHKVTLFDFYIGKYPVTVRQFALFIACTDYKTKAEFEGGSICYEVRGRKKGVDWRCDSNGSPRDTSDFDQPVIHIAWEDAVAFCKWMSEATGKTFRLPTEAEWEYAARGGNLSKKFIFSGSNDIDEVAWHTGNSSNADCVVGCKKANELGIYDMSGNVCEWCSDWFGPYDKVDLVAPKGPEKGFAHVLRGGSWNDYSRACRVSNRFYGKVPRFDTGFRVVMEYNQ